MVTLNTVAPSRRLVSAPQAQPVNLGEGLATGLTNLASAYEGAGNAEDTLQTALKARNGKISRAEQLSNYARMRGEYARDLTALGQEYPANGKDYYEASQRLLNEHTSRFLSGIEDKDIREEFTPRVTEFAQGQLTNNFSNEITRQSAYYVDTFGQLQQSALDSIQSGELTLEDWQPEFEDYIANSPLTSQETAKLEREWKQSIQSADFARQAKYEQENYTELRGSSIPDGESPHGKVAAIGLPAYAVGFLGSLLGPESGGKYNIMYSPDGERLFDSYADHPNQGATINFGPHRGKTSTAAGAYQFIHSTWKKAQAALNLPDFSPESQTRAAWWLAQQDYSANTGSNIDVDLASGDPQRIERVRKALESTWQGLENVSPAQFYNKVTGATGTDTGLMSDPRYENVPYSRKLELNKLAEDQRTQTFVKEMQRQTQITQTAINEMQQRISSGEINQQGVDAFAADANLSFEQEKELNTYYREEQAGQAASEDFASNLTSKHYSFGTGDTEGADQYYKRNQSQYVEERDLAGFVTQVAPTFAKTGIVPPAAKAELETMRLSSNTTDSQFAMQALSELSRLQRKGDLGISGISEDAQADALYYNRVAGVYKPEEQVLEQLRNSNSPENVTARKMASEQIKVNLKDKPNDFSAESIASAIDPAWNLRDLPIAEGQRMALVSDMQAMYEREFWRYGNHADTMEAVIPLMQREWGVSEASGTRKLMRLPPEKTGYKPHLNSYDYIGDQIREEIGEGDYELLSDNQTRLEAQQGKPASYRIVKMTPDGPRLATEEDGSSTRLAFDSPTQRIETDEEGNQKFDNQSMAVDAGVWMRKFREVRTNFYRSDSMIRLSSIPVDIRKQTFESLPAEERDAILEDLSAFEEFMEQGPPKGSEKIVQEYESQLEGMRYFIGTIQ